jgi:hypothetical protein
MMISKDEDYKTFDFEAFKNMYINSVSGQAVFEGRHCGLEA